MKKTIFTLLTVALITSCVSKKKYVALQDENSQIKSQLTKTAVEKEELEAKFAEIESRVAEYNSKISSLTDENNSRYVSVGDEAVMSNEAQAKMRETLAKVDPSVLAGASTLKDSMNIALAYNIQDKMANSNFNEDEDISIHIDETVVMISISDKLLFNTASYKVSNKADDILKKIADVVNSEDSMDLMVEGHTDNVTIHNEKVEDNWDLSVLRATSVVRKLQNEFGVAPEKLIASGRSAYMPVASNDSKEDRAKNRRTRIVILPNINEFFALMAANN